MKNSLEIHDINKIVNQFNNFFVNGLVVNIPKATEDDAGLNTIMENVDSIFLGKVERDEIMNIVKDCATDCEDLILVQNIIELVIEPFTLINISDGYL